MGDEEQTALAKRKAAAIQRAEASREFTRVVMSSAGRLLKDWVGEERAGEAIGRLTTAFSASALSARDAADFYACTSVSVAQCVAISALIGIMPGSGATALAYLIPRRPRKGEQPQLQFQLSHRGIGALAMRAGLVVFPIPVHVDDKLVIRDGEVFSHEANPDKPPMTWDELRGVTVLVKDARSGTVLFRGWVAKVVIAERREMSESYQWAEREGDWAKRKSTWHKWPVPMCMKTGTHYAVGRGWVVIDDTEAQRALSIDAAADIIDAEYTRTPGPQPTGMAAIGLDDDDTPLDELPPGPYPGARVYKPDDTVDERGNRLPKKKRKGKKKKKRKPEPATIEGHTVHASEVAVHDIDPAPDNVPAASGPPL